MSRRARLRGGGLLLGGSTLTDVVIGGTGVFEHASGTLTGTVHVAISNVRPAGTSVVKLAGTINF